MEREASSSFGETEGALVASTVPFLFDCQVMCVAILFNAENVMCFETSDFASEDNRLK